MKRKGILLTLAVISLVLSSSCGRGGTGLTDDPILSEEDISDEEEYYEAQMPVYNAKDQGGVLNICCSDDEAMRIFADYYPGYEQVDAMSGRIGSTVVNWSQISSGEDTEDEDERTDLFIVGAGEASAIVQNEEAIPLAELGIREKTLDEQFPYTKQVVSNADGAICGTSWECCPGVLFYNRDIAIEIFGSDDPNDVWDYVKTWDAFANTASIIKAAGYRMTASVGDMFPAYAQMASSPWVDEDALSVDSAYVDWANLSMAMVSLGQTSFAERFTSAWDAGFKSPGMVFCYPASAMSIKRYMDPDEEGLVAHDGRWGVTSAPTDFFDGGYWIIAPRWTDNPALAADIMRRLTLDRTIMRKMIEDDGIFVNNRALMEKAASNERPEAALGGQSPLELYIEVADRITVMQSSPYDYDCVTEFFSAMQNHFEGNATFDESMELFKTTIIERYPQLKTEE